MRTVFADSSALVKRYADELGADAVRSIPVLVASQFARVEVPAALWRKHRMGGVSAEQTGVLVAEFEADYFGTADEPPRVLVLAMTTAILDDAARLLAVHGLRAYDAVQLASACALRTAVPDGVVIAVFDEELRSAAASEGLELLSS